MRLAHSEECMLAGAAFIFVHDGTSRIGLSLAVGFKVLRIDYWSPRPSLGCAAPRRAM